jgi:uncharacterized protein (TIGR02246 family)
MKTILLTLVFFFSSYCLVFSQDAAEIRDVLHKQQDAWNAGNIEEFMRYYWKSDSLCFMTKNGVTNGWQNTLERYKRGYPDKQSMGKLTFDLIRIDLLAPDAALVAGKWLVDSATKSAEGHFNLLLRKKNGQWLIVLDHTS